MTAPEGGRVVTFYSFKGGTGRSMMLANVAWLLACNGRRVLTVDWDLEAPGLHRYFRPFLLDHDLSRSDGVIDFALDFCVAATTAERATTDSSPHAVEQADWLDDYADIARYAVPLRWEFPGPGKIDFVGAGRQGISYSTRVNGFSWADFYGKFGGGALLERTRGLMAKKYDFVLIDSRTGVSDTSGICTVQLPHILVVCFTLNNQSVDGAAGVGVSAREQGRGLQVLPVPMRIDNSEKDKLEARRDYAMERFTRLLPGEVAGEREEYWRDVEVPYVPYYAYEEVLATFKDRPGSAFTLLNSAERLASRIAGVSIRAMRMPETTRQSVLSTYEGRPQLVPTALPSRAATVYVSYRSSEISYASRLYDQLAATLGVDRVAMDVDILPGEDISRAAEEAIGGASVFLLIVGPDWATIGPSEFQLQEVTAASRLGRRIIPVLVAGATLPPQKQLESMGLSALGRVQAAVLNDATWQQDAAKLLAAVELASVYTYRESPYERLASRQALARPASLPTWSMQSSPTAEAGSTSAQSDVLINRVLKARSINWWSVAVSLITTVLLTAWAIYSLTRR